MGFIIIEKGVTRIVFLFSTFAIKIPNFKEHHLHFLQGCYSNWSERNYSKSVEKMESRPFFEMFAPCFFCSYFGLVAIYKRCSEKLDDLTEEEIIKYSPLHQGDYKKENFGYLNGKLVCLDYP